MKFKLFNIFSPHETLEAKDVSLEMIKVAIRSQVVQDHWLEKILDKLQKINFELDNLLDKPDRDRIWEALAVERRTLIRCLTLILESRDELESERASNEHRDEFYRKYQGVSAPVRQ